MTPLRTLFISALLFTTIAAASWAWLAFAALLASPGCEDPRTSRLQSVRDLHQWSQVARWITLHLFMLAVGLGVASLVVGVVG